MELYTQTSYELAEQLTKRYSTSFSASSRLFTKDIRKHIYAIYGLVRVADEIVDTYRGADAVDQLNNLKTELYRALESGFSANPIVHAFIVTAHEYAIDNELIEPFFESMASDLANTTMTDAEYRRYIYGSAEVVGLMCLKVFTKQTGDYAELAPGAQALGAAYQKVNFLRDIKADYEALGRLYFPGVTYESFDDTAKAAITADIRHDFSTALPALKRLPNNCRGAVTTSYEYYRALLDKLEQVPATELKQRRLRVADVKKVLLYVKAKVRR